MELTVLGRTNDDKGTQLEQLARDLLEKLGYGNIVVNEIAAGGQEIDVRAEILIPSLGGGQSHRVICECKAYSAAIRIPDWLKFLGKVFVEEARLNEKVYGCFIALSGVNGAVAGSYDALHRDRKEIELITGDGLVDLLKMVFPIASASEVANRVHSFTSRQFIHLSLCYYSKKLYWLVEFEGGESSLLSSEGRWLTANDCPEVQSILIDNTDIGVLVDLQAEAEAHRRLAFAERIVLAELMVLGGNSTSHEILENWLDTCVEEKWRSYSFDDIDDAAKHLAEQGLIEISDSDQLHILLPDEPTARAEQAVKLYRHLIREETPIIAFGCPFYDEHIDLELLERICEIQGGMSIPEEKRQDCLKLLHWSPEALAWALQPDPMIVKHREDGHIDENVEKTDLDYFIGQLLDRFNQDFNRGPLTRYFYSVRGLREIDTRRKVDVKSAEINELTVELRSRLGIGEMAEKYGGGVVRMLLLESSPEPWEWHKEKEKETDASKGIAC